MARARATYELTAEDKSARAFASLRRSLGDAEKAVKGLGLAVGAATTAGIAGIAAMVRANAPLIDTLGKTSDALGIEIENLQALEVIAGRSGVTTEQLSKNIERMERSLGQAARKGGPAAQALEDIGINLGSIINLSPDEQLEAIASALTGVENQALKASIANDLFGRDGLRMLKVMNALEKQGLRPVREELERVGFTITREGAAKVEEMNDALDDMDRLSKAVGQTLTVALSPYVSALATHIYDAAQETGGFKQEVNELVDDAVDGLAFIIDAVDGVGRTFELTGKGIATITLHLEADLWGLADTIVNGPGRAINSMIESVEGLTGLDIDFSLGPLSDDIQRNLRLATAAYNEGVADMEATLMEPLLGSALRQELEAIRNAADDARVAMGGTRDRNRGGNTGSGGASNADKASRDAINTQLTALRDQVATLGRSKEEMQLFALQSMGASASQLELARSLMGTISAFEAQQKLTADGARIYEETRTPMEQLNIEYTRLNELLEAGVIDWDTYARAVFNAQDQFDGLADKAMDAGSTMDEFAKAAAKNMQDAFGDLFYNLNGDWDDTVNNFIDGLRRIAAEFAAQELMKFLLGDFGSTGDIGGIVGSLFGGARASGGDVLGGRAYLVGEKGPELFMPGRSGTVIPNDGLGGVQVHLSPSYNLIDSRDLLSRMGEINQEMAGMLAQTMRTYNIR